MKSGVSELEKLNDPRDEVFLCEIPKLVYLDIGRDCSCSVTCVDPRKRNKMDSVEVKKALDILAKGGVKRIIFKGDYFYRQEGLFDISMYAGGLGLDPWFFLNGKIMGFFEREKENGDRLIEFRSEDFIEKRVAFLGTDMCGAGKLSCYINSCGSVSPCPNIPFRGGNIKEKDLIDIWKNDLFMNRFRYRSNDLPICENCELYF